MADNDDSRSAQTAGTGRTRSSGVELRLGDLDRLSVFVSMVPYASVLSLLTTTARPRWRQHGAWPRSLKTTVEDAWRDVRIETIRPMVEPGQPVLPDAVAPIDMRRDVPIDEPLDYLRSAPSEDLLDDLSAVFRGKPPSTQWRHVVDRPTSWLRDYAGSATRIWDGLEPLWRRAQPLFQRETERIAVAAARRQHHALFNNLADIISYADGSLFVPFDRAATFDLTGRALVLVPMLSGPRSRLATFDLPDAVCIAYPLASMGVLDGTERPTARRHDTVETLLGQQRAAILRMLDVATDMSALADRLHYSASTLTHHCNRLADAELITRERSGRRIVIRRTERGTALLDLLATE